MSLLAQHRRRVAAIAAATGCVAAAALTAGPAPATATGKNGQIAFRRYLGPNRTLGATFIAALDGSGERQLTRPPARGGDDFPDAAPHGSFVAFQRCTVACSVYIIRTDGTGVRAVGDGCTGRSEPPACPDNSYPAISPTGAGSRSSAPATTKSTTSASTR